MPTDEEIIGIDINDLKAWPVLFTADEINAAMLSEVARRLTREPFFQLLNPTADRGGKHFRSGKQGSIPQRYLQLRDRALDVIAPLVSEGFPLQLLGSPYSAADIKQRAVEIGCAKNAVIKYLRRYWQRGQVPNALLPDYGQCGGPGKRRVPGEVKMGRPRRAGGGRNVTDRDIAIFKLAIKRFKTQDNSLKMTYEQMLDTFYAEVPATATLPAVRLPADESPSFQQFEYWYYKVIHSPATVKALEGETAFGRKHRSTTSGAKVNAQGPGSVYIIDSTPADITLRSPRTAQIVGRPVLYLVIDLFTAMIVGFYVGFLHASMEAARLALYNAFRQKPDWVAEMGEKLTDEWPAHGLPQSLWIDGGELKGPIANGMIGTLVPRVAQMPSHRPDLKGDVESFFHKVKLGLIAQLPGASTRPRERGDRDPRLEAILTIEEFRSLVLHFVLLHNATYPMKKHPLAGKLAQQGIQATPLSLWQWSVDHHAGKLRSLDEDLVRLDLLPGDEASVTPSGLLYRGLYYDSGKPEHREWYERARIGGRWKVPIAFHPNDRSAIYLRPKKATTVTRFSLTSRNDGYAGYSFEEYELDQVTRAVVQAQAADEVGAKRSEFDHLVVATIAAARERTNLTVVPSQSKAAQVRRISNRRAQEKEAERKANTWSDLGVEAEKPTPPVKAETEDQATTKRNRKLSAYWQHTEGS